MEKNQLNLFRKVVFIGGSAGSLDVLLTVLPQLKNLDGVAVVIVLHRRNSDDHVLEELLRMKSGLDVEEIEDKTLMLPGKVYVAPADYHLLFESDLTFSLDVSEKVHYSRPSIDVAFESAAVILGDKLAAVLLSGANADGTDGLRTVAQNGGTVIVQTPETADVSYMPQFAINHVAVDFVLSPEGIGHYINNI